MQKEKAALQPIVRYKILAQYNNNILKVEDIWRSRELIMPVEQITGNQIMINQFAGADACTIGYILGSKSQHQPLPEPLISETKVASTIDIDESTESTASNDEELTPEEEAALREYEELV